MWHYNKDVNCDLSKEYNFAYAMGAPCSWDTPYNDRYSVTCTVPYKIASGMGQIVKFPQMTNITSADCGEILAEKEACAIQKTFTEGTVMQNYTEMRKFNTALHAATYTAYGELRAAADERRGSSARCGGKRVGVVARPRASRELPARRSSFVVFER